MRSPRARARIPLLLIPAAVVAIAQPPGSASAAPKAPPVARERIDCPVPLPLGCVEREYLGELRDRLPGFLDSAANRAPIALAIYNAGTDVYAGDPLGGLNVSAAGILERDLFVVEQLRSRGIATVMVLSGGYTRESYQLVAESVAQLIAAEERRQAAR